MKKGERLDIEVSVIATEDVDDHVALQTAANVLETTLARLTTGLPVKRFASGISICSKLKRHHRRVYTSRRRGPEREPESGATLQ